MSDNMTEHMQLLMSIVKDTSELDFPLADVPQVLVLSFAAPLRGWIRRETYRLFRIEPAGDREIWVDAVRRHTDERLSAWLTKIAIYELNLARQQQCLSSETPELRFTEYLQSLRQVGQLTKLYQKYQHHLCRVVAHLQLFLQFIHEVRQHFDHDSPRFDTLGICNDLSYVDVGKGDSHFGGRQVIEFHFGKQKLLYKPRSLQTDLLYARLVQRCNQHTALQLRASNNLDCGHYGWQQFEQAVALTGPAQCMRFYHSIGAHLALLRLLQVTDIHYDNMLTCKNGEPLFYDLETMFNHGGTAQQETQPFSLAHQGLLQQISHSVMQTAILPLDSRFLAGLNALTTLDKVDALVKSDELVNAGRDDMGLQKVIRKQPVRSHLPVLEGKRTNPTDYLPALEAGFRQVWQWLVQDNAWIREQLIAVRQLQARYVLRHTGLYAMFLAESCHPVYATGPQAFELLMAKFRHAGKFRPELALTVNDEIRQLWQMDIPAFRGHIDGLKLKGQFGEYQFFTESALPRSLSALSEDDDQTLKAQLQLMQRSLQFRPPFTRISSVDLSTLQQQLIDWIQQSRFAAPDGSISWLQVYMPEAGGGIWPMSQGLYHGLAGMLLLYCALERLQPGHYRPAIDVLQQNMLQMVPSTLTDVRTYQGSAGMLWALAQSAWLCGQQSLYSEVVALLVSQDLLSERQDADIIDGIAGNLLLVLSLYRLQPDDRLQYQAFVLADRLQQLAQLHNTGVSWPNRQGDNLCSFSHGGSGVAYALLSFARQFNQSSAQQLGLQALAFEDRQFSAAASNWPDVRTGTSETYNLTWCNGLTGHVLARGVWFDLLETWQQQQYQQALSHWQQQLIFMDHSVCHGLSGALLVSDRLDLQQYNFQLQQALCSQRPLKTGSTYDAGDLSLMTGFAGILYSLLRLRDKALPCPFTLENGG